MTRASHRRPPPRRSCRIRAGGHEIAARHPFPFHLGRAPRLKASSARGQATVELVAFLPLLLVAGLAGAAVLAAQSAGEQAGQAAHAGAMAMLQGGDPRAAARAALPAAVRARATVVVEGRRVTVRVRPRVPVAAVARHLTGEATADAGPEP
jgi:hypothetical protein